MRALQSHVEECCLERERARRHRAGAGPGATGKKKSLMTAITRLRLCVVVLLLASSLGSLALAQQQPRRAAPRAPPPPAATAPKTPRRRARPPRGAMRRCGNASSSSRSSWSTCRSWSGRWNRWRAARRRPAPGAGRQVPGPAAAIGAADAGRLDGIETQIRALAAQLEQVQEQMRALAAGAGRAAPVRQRATRRRAAARPAADRRQPGPARAHRLRLADRVARCQEGRDRPHPQHAAGQPPARRSACRGGTATGRAG